MKGMGMSLKTSNVAGELVQLLQLGRNKLEGHASSDQIVKVALLLYFCLIPLKDVMRCPYSLSSASEDSKHAGVLHAHVT